MRQVFCWMLTMATLSFVGCRPFGTKTIEPSADAPLADASSTNRPAPHDEPDIEPVIIEIVTNKGTISAELYPDKAPQTVANLRRYIAEGFYDGTIFHRVIPDFMIQGGGFTPELKEKTTHPPIPNEADNGLKNLRGTLAMARTPAPHSAASQFFINLKHNQFLNFQEANRNGYGYCVFGKVTDGMEIVDDIADVETTEKSGYENVPVVPVVIGTIRIVQQ